MRALALLVLLATLPTSPNPISAGNVQTEYGGAAPVSFSGYYRGGAYVVSGANTSIPTSGAISLHNFHGTTKPVVALAAQVNDGSGFYPGSAYGYCTTGGTSCTATTNSAVCEGVGGTPPYTVTSFTFVSGATLTRLLTNPNGQWRKTSGATGAPPAPSLGQFVATWRCTVTDSASVTATVDFSVVTEHETP